MLLLTLTLTLTLPMQNSNPNPHPNPLISSAHPFIPNPAHDTLTLTLTPASPFITQPWGLGSRRFLCLTKLCRLLLVTGGTVFFLNVRMPYTPYYCCFVWAVRPIYHSSTLFMCFFALFSLIVMKIVISNNKTSILCCYRCLSSII